MAGISAAAEHSGSDASASLPGIYVVALTGGIASGKTAASDRFAELGVEIIDTDLIARELVEPGQPTLEKIAGAFGRDFLDPSGRLDRRKLRHAVFQDENLRNRLESLLHPQIAEAAMQRVRQVRGPYCIVVIPLLWRRSDWPWLDRVLVVDVPESVQVERVIQRDHVDRGQALAILAVQPTREQRLALADDVVDNSGSLEALRDRVDALHKTYLDLAGAA